MARIRAVLRLSDDPYQRERQREHLAAREVTVLRTSGTVLWVSATESQLPRFAAEGIVAYRVDETETLRLPALAFDPTDGDPEPPAELTAPADHPYRLVLFAAPPEGAWVDRVIAAGATYVRDVPEQGAVFRVENTLPDMDFVLWHGPYHPAYAVDFALTGRDVPFTAITLAQLRIDLVPPRADGNLRVGLFDDADPGTVGVAVRAAGATVLFADGQALVLVADAAQVPAIARIPGVAAIESYAAPEPTLNRSRVIVGADQVAQGPHTFLVNLDGAGEIAAVADDGLDTGNINDMHVDLAGRVIGLPGMIRKDDTGHGTHVAGIIAGNGAGSATTTSPATVIGVAPAASILPQHKAAPLIDNLLAAYRAGARVHNNSWVIKLGVRPSLPPLPSRNLYLDASRELDRFLHAHPDLLVVFAAGNEERDFLLPLGVTGDGELDQDTLSRQQVAKNILCVGASENDRTNAGLRGDYRVNYPGRFEHRKLDSLALSGVSNDADQVALFSNRGRVGRPERSGMGGVVFRQPPAETRWVRPHLVAPGTNIVSVRSSTVPPPVQNPPTYDEFDPPANLPRDLYLTLTGTSMAAPHVAGAALLVRQYYRTFFRLQRRPRLLAEDSAGLLVNSFVDLPAVGSHVDGLVFAWLPPVAAGATTRIAAIRATSGLVSLTTSPVLVANDVGRAPAPRVARHGDATLVLYRQRADGIRLRRLDNNLTAVTAFGTVSVTTAASTTTARPPALAVADDRAAVAWVADGDGVLRFALFNALTGAAVGTPTDLGPATQLSPHGGIVHNGTNFALLRVESGGNRHRLWFHRLDAAGRAVGAPVAVVDQATPVRDPHLAWDPGRGRFLVVWCEATGVRLRFLDAAGGAVGAVTTPVPVAAGRQVRRPYVAAHPVRGGVLVWEDDIQGAYDVYHRMVDAAGVPHQGIPPDPRDPAGRRVLRISDTPLPTEGFAVTAAADGAVAVVWQSADEINSDHRGVYAVVVTADGTFQAQANPRTPLVRNGSYVNHTLERNPAFTPLFATVGACWAGGQRFLLRPVPRPSGLRAVALVRTTADGQVADTQMLADTIEADVCSAMWTGQRLVVVTAARYLGRPSVRVLDPDGRPIAGLPRRTLRGTLGESALELGYVPGPDSRILVAYQPGDAAALRVAVLDAALADTAPADHDLVPELEAGHVVFTARHGWFHYVHEENLVLATWTDQDRAGNSRAWLASTRRTLLGTLVRQDPARVTTVAGDSRNPVLAPRPVDILGGAAQQREYLMAFEFRSTADAPWEIRASRVDRGGRVVTTVPAPGPPTADVRVIFPGAAGWPAGTDAIEPQLACTYTDEPLSGTGAVWSPAFGLAFLGKAGGNRTLYFTLLDAYGRRVPDATGAPSPVLELTEATVDVLDFTLSWTGRYFWLTWVERGAGALRHRQTLVSRAGSRLAYDTPSAALLRATLLNGTKNLAGAALPNVDDGSGWGRLDLRQSLAPTPPVTFHVREDSVGAGGTLSYEFDVPSGTEQLRITLTWDDPPGTSIRNPITLHVVAPDGREYRGNLWNGPVSAPVPRAAVLPPVNDNVQQVRLDPPRAGRYRVSVRAGVFGQAPEQQFPAQAIALVFVGSGREVTFFLPK